MAGGTELQERWDCTSLLRKQRRYVSTIYPSEETVLSEGTVATENSSFVLFSFISTCQTLWADPECFQKLKFSPEITLWQANINIYGLTPVSRLDAGIASAIT